MKTHWKVGVGEGGCLLDVEWILIFRNSNCMFPYYGKCLTNL